MARLSNADMKEIAENVCAAHQQTGTIPEWLLEATKEALAKATFGPRLAFMSHLRENCPEAIRWFV